MAESVLRTAWLMKLVMFVVLRLDLKDKLFLHLLGLGRCMVSGKCESGWPARQEQIVKVVSKIVLAEVSELLCIVWGSGGRDRRLQTKESWRM